MKYAHIAFLQKTGKDLKGLLTYSIPDNLNVKEGQSISAAIRGRAKAGVVIGITSTPPTFKTMPIQEIIINKPLLTKDQVRLINWMSEYYLCPIYKILKLFISPRILANKAVKTRKKEVEQLSRTVEKELTPSQKDCIKNILENKLNKFLIHGVTGSGKTEVYTRLAKNYIDLGKQVLILVPEISLTRQTIDYFETTIGHKASVIHSKLSEGEKHKSWLDIWDNKAKLIIGSRSCIFAPFQNLGLIVVDEEHESSYKQDNSPRYHTHTVAEQIQEYDQSIKIVYASATPSVEALHNLAESTIELNERIGESVLPEVEIVDLREEFHKKNFSIFSESLQKEIKNALEKKEQVLLFLNRRGSSSSVVCRDCGYTEICTECDTKFTYHTSTLAKPTLICHHCGVITTPPTICKQCKGQNIKYLGIGTQKIELEAKKAFPEARILRADKDTTSTKEGWNNIYKDFKAHKADILIGTQMIAKGLHLPKVNLVGVILADIGLSIPDYRTNERNFQLMTQVAGRAGRTEKKGKVIIQTYTPEAIAITHTKSNDFAGFYRYERTQRKLMNYPPFSKLAKIEIQLKGVANCKAKAQKLEDLLWTIAREKDFAKELEINNYPAYITQYKGIHRFIVLIKSFGETTKIHNLLDSLPKEYIMDPSIKIDIDPISTT